jgi:hypothetical protein
MLEVASIAVDCGPHQQFKLAQHHNLVTSSLKEGGEFPVNWWKRFENLKLRRGARQHAGADVLL